jgi:cell division protein ZapA (FtsZ GTPase activity inhibitor)
MIRMEELSVTINIAGRPYRLKTDICGKEVIEEASVRIEDSLSLFAKHHGRTDTQDLMAMVLLQHTVDLLKGDREIHSASDRIGGQITMIEALLSEDNDRRNVL